MLTVTVTEDMFMARLRDFLRAIVPAGVEIVQAQANRVPQPLGESHVVMTPKGRMRLSTTSNLWAFDDPAPDALEVAHSMQLTVTLDIHGEAAGDLAQTIAVLFNAQYAVDNLDPSGDIAPLYASEGRQAPFITGEMQFETRWTMDLVMHSRPAVSTPQQFAHMLGVTVRPVPIAGG